MRKIIQKTLCTALSAAMVLSLAACRTPKGGEEPAGLYTEGSYTASARGYGGTVEVTVEVNANSIVNVTATGDKETEGIGSKAIEQLPAAIVTAQSTDVDVVSGATISSQAVIEAAKAALDMAAGHAPAVTAASINMTPGTYEAEANGHSSMIGVAVTVDETAIKDIKITKNGDTEHLYKLPAERIPAQIIERQSLNVDAVSGATFTSNAILSAVTDALEQANADIAVLQSKPAPEKPIGTDVELEADVVIVGGGFAGLSAAAAAAETGASVLVLEKMPVLGGNGVLSGGIYNAVDPVRQTAQGIEDSIELHIQNTYEGGDKIANLDLIQLLCEGSLGGLQWMEDNGLEVKDTITQGTGALYPRTHTAVMPYGTGYLEAILTSINKSGNVTILMETKANELIVENGEVTGVKAIGLADNNTYTFQANKGVILATGGFAANVEMRQKYNTSGKWDRLDASILTTNPPGATGDGLVMAEAIGANLIDMDQIQLLPLGNPRTGSSSNLISTRAGIANVININIEGKRYVAEDERRDVLSAALIKQPEAKTYLIVDSHKWEDESLTSSGGTPLADLVAQGDVVKGETIEELAIKLGIDPAVLTKTIDDFNAAVDAGTDEFGRIAFEFKLDQGPFYADVRVPAVHHTMGGVQINTNAEVIDINGEVIPGLFAAGEVTGGIHGSNRLGGNAIPDTIVFGRIAGANAVK